MNVAVYIGHLSIEQGGGYSFQNNLINALHKLVSKHDFVIVSYSSLEHISDTKTVKAIQIEDFKLWDRLTRKARKLLGIEVEFKNSFDRYCTVQNIHLVWYPTFIFEETSVPYIYTIWDLQHRLQPFFPEVRINNEWERREKHFRKVLSKASYVLTGTEQGKKEITSFYGISPEIIRLLPHFTPKLAPFEHLSFQLHQFDITGPYVFYPAQFWSHKNHITLLRAFGIVKEQNQDLQLVLCGSDKGNLKLIKSCIIENDLEDIVKIVGFVSQEELSFLYTNARMLVYPTLFGPENLPPLEAMSCSIPCAVSDVPGSNEQYGDAVLYFNRFDEKDMAKAILELNNNEALRSILIEKGKINAAKYTPLNYLQDIENIINDFSKISQNWIVESKKT